MLPDSPTVLQGALEGLVIFSTALYMTMNQYGSFVALSPYPPVLAALRITFKARSLGSA
jgi:hypothetical protein